MVAPERSSCRSVSHLFQLAAFHCSERITLSGPGLRPRPPLLHIYLRHGRDFRSHLWAFFQIEESLC